MIKLFVSGFPPDIEEIELAKLIGLHGDIETLKMVRDKQTRICKGYAFIEVTDQASAENIIDKLNGLVMGDRSLKISVRDEISSVPSPTFKTPNKNFDAVRKKRPRRSN